MVLKNFINKISQKHFNSSPNFVMQILDKGKVNKVFKVLIKSRAYIFRINDRNYLSNYKKEFFCIKKASEAGIPTSEVYFVGEEDGYSFMILNYVEGKNGVDLPEEKHNDVYRNLGQFASKFNCIEMNGFGRMGIDDEEMGFTKDWNKFYEETMDGIFGDNILIDNGILTLDQSEKIKNRLSKMKDWNFKPRLCHGNLHITNTIITPEEKVYVIDWGNGAGNIAPHVDLADLIAWKDRKYLDSFLEGYGMTKEKFNEIEHDVHNFLIIQLLNVIKYSVENKNGFLKDEFISSSIERIMNLS